MCNKYIINHNFIKKKLHNKILQKKKIMYNFIVLRVKIDIYDVIKYAILNLKDFIIY